jgi:hypothetical protein
MSEHLFTPEQEDRIRDIGQVTAVHEPHGCTFNARTVVQHISLPKAWRDPFLAGLLFMLGALTAVSIVSAAVRVIAWAIA